MRWRRSLDGAALLLLVGCTSLAGLAQQAPVGIPGQPRVATQTVALQTPRVPVSTVPFALDRTGQQQPFGPTTRMSATPLKVTPVAGIDHQQLVTVDQLATVDVGRARPVGTALSEFEVIGPTPADEPQPQPVGQPVAAERLGLPAQPSVPLRTSDVWNDATIPTVR